MSYFHVRIDYLDRKIKTNQTEFVYDLKDKQVLKEKILTPYLSKRDIFINGINFEYGSIRAIKLYESNQDIHSTVELGDSWLGPNALIYYTKEEILGEQRFAPDVTNKIFDDMENEMEITDYTTGNHIKTSDTQPKKKLFISHS